LTHTVYSLVKLVKLLSLCYRMLCFWWIKIITIHHAWRNGSRLEKWSRFPAVRVARQSAEQSACFESQPIIISCSRDTWAINKFNGCSASLWAVMPPGTAPSAAAAAAAAVVLVPLWCGRARRWRRRMWRAITSVRHAITRDGRHLSLFRSYTRQTGANNEHCVWSFSSRSLHILPRDKSTHEDLIGMPAAACRSWFAEYNENTGKYYRNISTNSIIWKFKKNNHTPSKALDISTFNRILHVMKVYIKNENINFLADRLLGCYRLHPPSPFIMITSSKTNIRAEKC